MEQLFAGLVAGGIGVGMERPNDVSLVSGSCLHLMATKAAAVQCCSVRSAGSSARTAESSEGWPWCRSMF